MQAVVRLDLHLKRVYAAIGHSAFGALNALIGERNYRLATSGGYCGETAQCEKLRLSALARTRRPYSAEVHGKAEACPSVELQIDPGIANLALLRFHPSIFKRDGARLSEVFAVAAAVGSVVVVEVPYSHSPRLRGNSLRFAGRLHRQRRDGQQA